VTPPPNSVAPLLRIRDFVRQNGGSAAVEFAILLPTMLVALLGAINIEDGIAISIKNAITARTVADLASQYINIYNSDMSTILNASSEVIAPYASANLAVTVSQVTIDAQGRATITWSDTLNGTARLVGSTVGLPSGMATPNTSLIWGEVSYNYTPNLPYVLTTTLTLSNQIFMSPRLTNSVTRINS